eukprot:TRINITY_DN27026_c0_g1_i1.p1 TRINITY_DN27026_c0_g1~~TRINITY_DN27026_c0_g1_i1.p1  ORF type:complete len:378 (+),score=87.35 TRINITY_DN27026_c0_g1_i1:32-1135(+)
MERRRCFAGSSLVAALSRGYFLTLLLLLLLPVLPAAADGEQTGTQFADDDLDCIGESCAAEPEIVTIPEDDAGVPQAMPADSVKASDSTDDADVVPMFTGPLAGAVLITEHRIVSLRRSETAEELKAEVVAAEAALSLRAQVGGPPVVYDSPGVSIAVQKVEAENLTNNGLNLTAPNDAGVMIPADPRIVGRHGGPVTVSVSSFHAGEKIKELPEIKSSDFRHKSADPSDADLDGPREESEKKADAGAAKPEVDRVDFFMKKTGISWRGTVNVKVPGLGASVPAHDREGPPPGASMEEAEQSYPEEKQMVKREMMLLASLPQAEQQRKYRELAKQWHPDKNPGDTERAADIFAYLQRLKEDVLGIYK